MFKRVNIFIIVINVKISKLFQSGRNEGWTYINPINYSIE